MVSWKITFFFKLCITLAETLYDLDKRNPSKCKMSNFDCSMKFHQICILIGSLCCKYIKVQLKKNRGFMSHEDWCKIWRKTDLLFQKYKNLLNFDLSTQNSQNFHFDWFFLCKICNVWPKKAQRSYLSWHWRVMQNLKKNWLVV